MVFFFILWKGVWLCQGRHQHRRAYVPSTGTTTGYLEGSYGKGHTQQFGAAFTSHNPLPTPSSEDELEQIRLRDQNLSKGEVRP